jgi:HEAT repeat protein
MIRVLIAALLVAGPPAAVQAIATSTAAAGDAQAGQESALYKQGTTALDKADWGAAVAAFEKVAASEGERADAALYWQAYALNKQGRRDLALKALAALKSGYPKSRWIKDAGVLELEVRQASGQTPEVGQEANDDLKLMALSGLMNADPDRALPLIKQMLGGSPPQRVRDRALFVLAQSGSPEARQMLVEMAKTGANPDLQAHAIHYLGLFGGKESRQTLLDLYAGNAGPEARKAVLNALMVSGDRQSLAAIARKETSPELRRQAINQLGVSGGREELWQMYQESADAEAKRDIINALFVGGGVDQLTELAKSESDPGLRRAAIERLGLTGAKSAPTLRAIYAGDKDPGVKRAVLNALFLQNNAAALVEIARQEQDPALKREAVQKLSIMHSKEAADYMLELLK